MDPTALLAPHVVLSLIGIASGFMVMGGFLRGHFASTTIAIFLVTTTLTSLTGYVFERDHVLPSHIVGAIALLVLIPTWLAWRPYRLAGGWLRTFVIGATISQWFNLFVLVAQLFLKVPSLHALAPKGSEPPFAIAQALVLLAFVAAGFVAWRRTGSASAHRIKAA